MSEADGELTIGEVAARTGLSVPALRMWESRHGVPAPRRLPGGHRRYSARDVELVQAALRSREAGLSLPAALRQARLGAAEPVSIYARLREARPDLRPAVFSKRMLVALSHAIEDECCSRAERPLLFAGFQRERFYRAAEPRWRQLAAGAELAVVFADFARSRRRPRAPIEIPVERSSRLMREWVLVCDAPELAACLAAWELPAERPARDGDRRFETVWTTEPDAVRSAALMAWRLARASVDGLPKSPDGFRRPPVEPPDAMRRLTELANRMLAYAAA